MSPRKRNSTPALTCLSQTVIGLTGARRGSIPEHVLLPLIYTCCRFGHRFYVSDAPGVDACFRSELEIIAAPKTTVFCASAIRARSFRAAGFQVRRMNRNGLSVTHTLHQRTVAMVTECSILVLLPDDPRTGTWDESSRIAFNVAVQLHKPVFVVTTAPPLDTAQFRVFSASLFGVVSGYWALPFGVGVPALDGDSL